MNQSSRHNNCLDKSMEVQDVDNTKLQCQVSDVKIKAFTQTNNLFLAS